LLILSSCTQHLVCPAYQSAFIFDKPTAREKFFYYNESKTASKEIIASSGNTITLPPRDSSWANSVVVQGPALPQARRVKMDRYLLLPEKTYKKAVRSLQTVETKQILPKKEELDSAAIASALDSAARSVTDTITMRASAKPKPEAADTAYAITKTKEKYNMDQDIYMWYFRDILLLPDVRAAMQEDKAAAEEKAAAKQGFFKRLFGKKDKSAKVKNVQDTVSVDDAEPNAGATRKKKSLNPFKKKKADSLNPEEPKKDPAKKEEDDGF